MGEPPAPLVLFLCTANSARSQMAEAILRLRAGDRYRAASAGLEPTHVHPLTIRVLDEIGADTRGLRSKSASEYLARVSVHHAIIVCDRAQRACPRIFPFALRVWCWPFEDPASLEGTEEARLEKFRDVRDQIDERLRRWLSEPEDAAGEHVGRLGGPGEPD